MVEYILGNYLVDSGRVSRERLDCILEGQDSVRVKLGLIAVSEGMMTTEQAEEINRLQFVTDKRFGDLAVEKGYLSDEQIGKLLKEQGNTYLMFVQNIVDEGIMTIKEIDIMIAEFKKLNGFSNTDIEDIKSDDADRIVPLYIPDDAKQYKDVIGIAVRTVIRLIDRHAYIGKASVLGNVATNVAVKQNMTGDEGIIDGFYEGDGGLLKVCSVFGQETFEELGDDALDAAGEFLNCVNGLYVSELSRTGRFLELMPPEYTDVTEKVKSESVCSIPIHIGNSTLYFMAAELA